MINDIQEFSQRVREERSRTDRHGTPFCLILISMDRMPEEQARALTKTLFRFQTELRLSDVTGWYDRMVFGILLPGTTEEEASRVVERLRKAVASSNNARSLREMIERGDVLTIMEYPRDVLDCLWNGRGGGARGGPGGGDERRPGHPLMRFRFLEKSSLLWRRHRSWNSLRMHDFAKRLIDIVLGSLCLLIFSPLMLAVAFLIKITSRGPVLFTQKRIGRHGREFTFYKFRTMYHNCDDRVHREYVLRLIRDRAEKKTSNNRSYFKLVDDPRITPLGRVLRKTSLDELPQLFNVLKGDMSLVGPRPPIPYEVEQYDLWQLRRVLEVKPGITGLWQVSGRASTTFSEQVRLDLRYVANHSLWMDILILFRTLKAVCDMTGAA